MKRWTPAIRTFAGLAAAGLALALFGPLYACAVAVATLWSAGSSKRIVGNAFIPPGMTVDPQEVRRYRVEHPGVTISEAVAGRQ
ncbi:hypothetical protein ACO0E1_01935 [Curtobacterium sp. RRHDQ66]